MELSLYVATGKHEYARGRKTRDSLSTLKCYSHLISQILKTSHLFLLQLNSTGYVYIPKGKKCGKRTFLSFTSDKCGKMLNSCRVSELIHNPRFGKQTNKQKAPIKIIALSKTQKLCGLNLRLFDHSCCMPGHMKAISLYYIYNSLSKLPIKKNAIQKENPLSIINQLQ